MCNEREDSVWYISPDGKASTTAVDNDVFVTTNPDDTCISWDTAGLVASHAYTKEDHNDGGVGLNRKFDPELVSEIDRVYQGHWSLPEYLPFRECVKMGIQDGMVAGMKLAEDKYNAIIAEKDSEIKRLAGEASRWKNAFSGLVDKCRTGIEAFEFIMQVAHCGKDKK
jgi:hypothetical protein